MTIWFGGDYNPEQWDESVWNEDIELMQEARVSLVTVGVFSWSMLEPQEGQFTFEWLDRVMDKLQAAGVRVDLATATASPPAWLAHRYPTVLPVTIDGVTLRPGSRQHYCPSSPDYRRLATRLAATIAERYASHPALEMWHINNEYGCHVSRCYCEASAVAFRRWLVTKYGTVDKLNRSWGTTFWSQRFGSFDEIQVPGTAPTFRNPGQMLDFDRFSSDELLGLLQAETAVVRAHSPGVPLTTNFMGFFKPLNYWKWAAELDFVSDDSYPDPGDPDSPYLAAMTGDLMRSLGGGQPWILMEQAVGAVTWRSSNAAKPEGMMRASSYQAVARGADGVLFFQWRQSERGAERFLTGMLPHTGTDSTSWRAVRDLGRELHALGDSLDSPDRGDVAIMLDWDSWWSIEQDALPSTLDYIDGVRAWYRSLYEAGVSVDFVNAESDLSAYECVIVPSMFVTSARTLERLQSYVEAGGRLVVTYQTGITDEEGRLTPGGYLGTLASLLGVRIDEFFPLPLEAAHTSSSVRLRGDELGVRDATATLWSERIVVDDADVVARFASGPLADRAAITRRSVASGRAWYVATLPDHWLRTRLLASVLDGSAVDFRISAASGVEITRRGRHRFVINHTATLATVLIEGDSHVIEPYGVLMLDLVPVV